VTAANFEQVVCDEYVEEITKAGAMYLWFYVYRPVGADPSPELAVPKEKLLELRRTMLKLRRRHPIILIDTYWDAKGNAVCPAARGLGFHIGPGGDIEPCPPLSFAADHIDDGDLFEVIDGSDYLKGFQGFVDERTRGCVILETPADLIEYANEKGAHDTSGRDLAAELSAAEPRSSHDIPGEEIPEDYWLYRMLKKRLFFGMGGYG
jgi:MoaA/NifB/PqqE/SkfB family radical SAM enzyme